MNKFWKIATGLDRIPASSFIEVFGFDSTGKTSLGLYLCKEAEKDGMDYVVLDAERGIPEKFIKAYGIKQDKIVKVSNLKEVFEIARNKSNSIICWDTLGATPSSDELKDTALASQPRELSIQLRISNQSIRDKNNIFLILNQARVPIKPFQEVQPASGIVLNYYLDLKIFVKRKEQDEERLVTELEVRKSRFNHPHTKAYVVFIDGILNEEETILENAVHMKIVETKPRGFRFKNKDYSKKEILKLLPEIEEVMCNAKS